MKQLLITAFFGLLLISSCTCNEGNGGNEEMNDNNTAATTADNSADDNTPNAAQQEMSDADYALFYNLNNYTIEQVKEYRTMQQKNNNGTVHGFYPEASTRLLTEDDVKYLTEWGHKVMLNEIYARHGKVFTTQDLIDHFNTQSWYKGNKTNVTDMLSSIEQENVAFLNNHPAEHITPNM